MKAWESAEPEVPSLNGWSEVLAEVQARIAPRFARAEVRERVGRYLIGLIDPVERKNGWQPAEAVGEQRPQGVQRLPSAAGWDAEGYRRCSWNTHSIVAQVVYLNSNPRSPA